MGSLRSFVRHKELPQIHSSVSEWVTEPNDITVDTSLLPFHLSIIAVGSSEFAHFVVRLHGNNSAGAKRCQ